MKIYSLNGELLGSIDNTQYIYGRHSVGYNAAFCGRMSVQLGAKMPDQFSFDRIEGLRTGEIYRVDDTDGNSINIEIDKIDNLRIESHVILNEQNSDHPNST